MISKTATKYTKRACYQGGYLWNESFENNDLPDPCNWGWAADENGKLKPLWQSECSNIDIEIFTTSCSCQKAACKNCKCAKLNLECLVMCGCGRKCK